MITWTSGDLRLHLFLLLEEFPPARAHEMEKQSALYLQRRKRRPRYNAGSEASEDLIDAIHRLASKSDSPQLDGKVIRDVVVVPVVLPERVECL